MESQKVTDIPTMELTENDSFTSDEVMTSEPQGCSSTSDFVPVALRKLWHVATIKQHGIGKLFGIPVRDNETGEEVFRKIQIRFGKRKLHNT
jgi:hypothetical protein